MADEEFGNAETVMLTLDIEGASSTAKVMQYLQNARGFLIEQKQKAGIDPNTNPSAREIELVEAYAEGRYVMSNTQSHSDTLFNTSRADIRAHVQAIISNKTEDGTATGTNQFKKSAGNPGTRLS